MITLKEIEADDDSTTRALVQHECNNKKGRLPPDMPQPEWLTGPSHRTKSVAKAVYLRVSLSKNASSCTKVDYF